jgi:hypothetical protein
MGDRTRTVAALRTRWRTLPTELAATRAALAAVLAIIDQADRGVGPVWLPGDTADTIHAALAPYCVTGDGTTRDGHITGPDDPYCDRCHRPTRGSPS